MLKSKIAVSEENHSEKDVVAYVHIHSLEAQVILTHATYHEELQVDNSHCRDTIETSPTKSKALRSTEEGKSFLHIHHNLN